MRPAFPVLAVAVVAAVLSAASSDVGAQTRDAPERCPANLPAPVVARQQAILTAARAGDYVALRRQVTEPDRFAANFGDPGDPAPAWREAQRQGVNLAGLVAAIFAMPCSVGRAEGRTYYSWPSAADFAWSALTPAEQSALQRLYGGKLDSFWLEGRAKGYYVGWRGAIDDRGVWTSFLAGD